MHRQQWSDTKTPLYASGTAGVRDVWARKDAADATGSVLTLTVAPEDSAFVVLSPKK